MAIIKNHQKSSEIITVELYAPTIIIRNHQKSSTIIIFLRRGGVFNSNQRYTPSQQALLEHKGVCPIVGLEPL